MQSQGHVVAMAHNNAWSNHRLLSACEALTPEAFAAELDALIAYLQMLGTLVDFSTYDLDQQVRHVQNDAGRDKVGRDHNTYGFSMWVAGGGMKGGQVIGATGLAFLGLLAAMRRCATEAIGWNKARISTQRSLFTR